MCIRDSPQVCEVQLSQAGVVPRNPLAAAPTLYLAKMEALSKKRVVTGLMLPKLLLRNSF